MIDILFQSAPTAHQATHGLELGPSALSAIAATVAALVAAAVGGIQLYVGRRQSQAALLSAQAAMRTAESAGRRRIAEFRQAWIERVRDLLSELAAIQFELGMKTDNLTEAKATELFFRSRELTTKLELLLNPNEPLARELVSAVRLFINPENQKKGGVINTLLLMASEARLVEIAQPFLKVEWDRLKNELLQ
jgi:hypothetical protein